MNDLALRTVRLGSSARAQATARRSMKRLFSLFACAAAILRCVPSIAAPYVPERDDIVLEKALGGLTSAKERELRGLQATLRSNPRNLDVALRVAQAYIVSARETSDPRFMGYAQASLSPWWTETQPPVAVLVLRATIRQHQHEFKPALTDLQQALARDPRNVQAWLTRSTVELVVGDPRAARDSCTRLAELSSALIAKTCLASADAMLGQASAAYETLLNELGRSRNPAPGIEAWSRSVLAEIAETLGKDAQAERLYREALAVVPGDAYTRAAFADFLLDRGRAKEVLDFVSEDSPADPILLRAVLAADRAGDPRAERLIAQMTQRFYASRARGDKVHLREEARFELHVRRNVQRALELAAENWRTQKELADARILMEAALAARKPEAARPALDYLSRFGIESAPLSRLRSQLQKAA